MLKTIAETIREIGVLWLVFGLLDEFIKNEAARTSWVITTVVAGGLCIAVGILLEHRGEQR